MTAIVSSFEEHYSYYYLPIGHFNGGMSVYAALFITARKYFPCQFRRIREDGEGQTSRQEIPCEIGYIDLTLHYTR